MLQFSKLVTFVVKHRRPIGVIVGAVLSIIGVGDFSYDPVV